MIGGNVVALIQKKGEREKNAIGEYEHGWTDVASLKGFLDLSAGDSKHTTYNAKIQESTHIFLTDFRKINVTSENSRMLINSQVYQIQLIDDPMNLHQHLEIYLKFSGGQSV